MTTENWAACVKHMVNKVEQLFWEQDHLIEQIIDKFMIHIGSQSDDKEDESINEHGNTGI